MTRARWIAAGGIAAVFLALHLPFLPASLEDLDSINFALGVRHFDVANHQPHPPGYPVFILLAKTVRAVVPSEVVALSLLGVVAGALSVFALVQLFGRLDALAANDDCVLPATLLTVGAPLYWFTASRPLSDMTGLAAALGIQAATLAANAAQLTLVSFLAGVAVGIRSQVAWLTVPLLAFQLWTQPNVDRGRALLRSAVAFGAGVLLWAVPLVLLTGGPAAYWRALFKQGAEDLSGVVMVWTTPTPREFARALYYALVAPSASVALATIVLILAAIGVVQLATRGRTALATLAAAFLPYAIFDILFQETITTRYSLPIVVPIGYLAACGLTRLGRRPALAVAAVVAAVGVTTAEQTLSGYARAEAPAFRMLEEMHAAEATSAAVLAMHRKEYFDLRRPIDWVGSKIPAFAARLQTPPKHEWLEVVKYWNGGGRAPIWFVADPLRSDLALFDHGAPEGSYRWPFDAPDLIGGVRPSEMDWYVVDPPGWYLGQGWAVTPETAGVAREDGSGPARTGATGWIRRQASESTLMIGGRNLSGPPATVRVLIDDQMVDTIDAPPGFFFRMLSIPAATLEGAGDYATIRIVAAPASGFGPADVAIEQFDARPSGHLVFGFGPGWNEQEYNPVTGKSWRWTSDRAAIEVRSAQMPLKLDLRGETETFSKPSHVIIRAGDRVIADQNVGSSFAMSVGVPAEALASGQAVITIETDQTYVPAERRFRSRDQRRLGLKIYDCVLRPSS